MSKLSSLFLIGFVLAALAGSVFSAVSTYDFVQHLDRQVHAITCSYLPGTGVKDTTGSSGCAAALMSPYSSVYRQSTWGGIPIALPGLAVFAYLMFLGLDLLISGRRRNRVDAAYLVAATLVPVITSVVYYYISKTALGTFCKVCVGIYVSSFAAFLFAVLALLGAGTGEPATGEAAPDRPWIRLPLYFVEGCLFVALAVTLYLNFKPVYGAEIQACGSLIKTEDRYGVMIPVSPNASGVPAIEVIDPLCPACSGFRNRLRESGLKERLDIRGVLFPLDSECNWMLKEPLHPGACTISEAVLCAGSNSPTVIDWALDNSAAIRQLATEKGSAAVAELAVQKFPDVAGCLGKPEVKTRINRSLRWIVSNSLSLTTPQLFVSGTKVCDEDTDLGLEYTLARMLERPQTAAAPANPQAR